MEIHFNITTAQFVKAVENLRTLFFQLNHIMTLQAQCPCLEINFPEQLHHLRTHISTKSELGDIHFINPENVPFWKKLHEVVDMGFIALERTA